MINPLVSIAGGMVRAYNADTAAAKKQAYDLAQITAKYQAEADAADALLPKLYITGDNGDRINILDNNGKTINFPIDKASNEFDASSLASTWMSAKNLDSVQKLSPTERQRFLEVGHNLKELVAVSSTKTAGDNIYSRDNFHPILAEDFIYKPPTDVVSGPTMDNSDMTAVDDEGTIKGVMVPEKHFSMKTVNAYADSIVNNDSTIKGKGFSPEKARRFLVNKYGPAALEFAASIPDLELQVMHGELNYETINKLVAKSYEYFPETTDGTVQKQAKRDRFVINVIRSASNDYYTVHSDGWKNENMKDVVDNYAGNLGFKLKDKDAVFEATESGLLNTLKMIDLVKDWQRDNPDQPVPAGGLGRLQGTIANFLDPAEGGLRQIGSMIGMFADVGGFRFEKDGKSKLQNRIMKKFTPKYIAEVGEFRAQYEVYEEFIAYQLAAALQGGTGGRTISDQDVLNIKKAMGNSLFQSGTFLMHRLEEIGSFLQGVYDKNRLYAEANSVGDLQTAEIFKKYTYGVKIAAMYRNGNNEKILVDRHGSQNYLNGELSATALHLLENLYIEADRKAGKTNLLNGPQLIKQGIDPETGEPYDVDNPYGTPTGEVDSGDTSSAGDGTKENGTIVFKDKKLTVKEAEALRDDPNTSRVDKAVIKNLIEKFN